MPVESDRLAADGRLLGQAEPVLRRLVRRPPNLGRWAAFMALNAAIAAYYYLRLVGVMYLRSPVKPLAPRRDYAVLAVILACGLAIVGLFVFPQWLQDVAVKARTRR